MKAECYPACETCGVHHRYGVSHADWLIWKERLSRAHETRTHYVSIPATPEVRAKIAAASRGRQFTDETRRKISAALRARTVRPETREKLRRNMTERWQDPEFVRKARGKRITSIERITYGWLNELGVRFHREVALIGGIVDAYCPDFDLIVEVDGRYWHPPGNLLDTQKDHDRALSMYATVRLPEERIRSGEARADLVHALRRQRRLARELQTINFMAERAASLRLAERAVLS